ncbi:MAG: hypothetical protein PARBB_00685 [Parabacteroides distasonis]
MFNCLYIRSIYVLIVLNLSWNTVCSFIRKSAFHLCKWFIKKDIISLIIGIFATYKKISCIYLTDRL